MKDEGKIMESEMFILEEKCITSDMVLADREIETLYKTAFLTAHQVPYNRMPQYIDGMPLDFLAYYLEGRFVGFLVVWRHAKVNWVWYLAVKEEFRRNGYGKAILSRYISKHADRPTILEREEELYEFYRSVGFADTDKVDHYNNGGPDMGIMVFGDWNLIGGRAGYEEIKADQTSRVRSVLTGTIRMNIDREA
jgi:GNAT superfamily N-acetyltransferase